jgi:hypothetical protein
MGVNLEGIVAKAAAQLSMADRAKLEASQDETQDRTEIGSKLDSLVTQELRALSPANGWIVHANRQVKTFPGIDSTTCGRTIEDFVQTEVWYHLDDLRPMFRSPRSGKDRLVGNLRPDLIIQEPTMILTIWDLTSVERSSHLVKTILYAHVFARGKYLCRIGETFWAGMKVEP